MNALDKLLRQVRACTVCAPHLPHDPRPILRAAATARLLIVGQAPGRKVHDTGIPWNDPSGDRLRAWLGMDRDTFYDEGRVAIIPTGFCYPGTGKGGDLPPRPECAPLWHPPLLAALKDIRLTLLIGQYAQAYYLGPRAKSGTAPGSTLRVGPPPEGATNSLGRPGTIRGTLTETVAAWKEYLPEYLPLPHPSPRNQLWLKRNPWFERDLLPVLRQKAREALA